MAAAREIPREYRAVIDSARQIGARLFIHDVAAWRATDELMGRSVMERDPRLRGWLTDEIDGGEIIVVTFIGEEDGRPMALYRVNVPTVDGSPRYEALKQAQPLKASQLARWKARVAAMEALPPQDRCSSNYNTVVLPFDSASGDLLRVYLFAATEKSAVMVTGGHFRYEFSADGERLINRRAFTKSCLEVSTKPAGDGKELEGVFLTHPLDPTPTEVHVFLSRSLGTPIYLATTQNELLWLVNGLGIELLDAPKETGGQQESE
jgi:hypothetical protein